MIQGGYQILDFGNLNISSSKKISGLYTLITNTEKPFLLRGVYDGSTYFKPFFAQAIKSSTNWTFACGSKTITITSADGVTIAS